MKATGKHSIIFAKKFWQYIDNKEKKSGKSYAYLQTDMVFKQKKKKLDEYIKHIFKIGF